MSFLPTNQYGEFDYENAFESCIECKRVFWMFDVNRYGRCEQCAEGRP